MIDTQPQRTRPPNGFGGLWPPAMPIPGDDDVSRAVEIKEIPDPLELQCWDGLVQTESQTKMILGSIDVLVELAELDPPLQHNVVFPVLLLEGDPGVGKTDRIRSGPSVWADKRGKTALQLTVKARELGDDGLGGTPKKIGAFFDLIKAQAATRRLIFVIVNEAEDVWVHRDTLNPRTNPADAERGVTAAIQGLDELVAYRNVVSLWSTNRAHRLDPAVLSRTTFRLAIPPLDDDVRRQVVHRACAELVGRGLAPHLSINDFGHRWPELARRTAALTGRDLKNLTTQAAVSAGGFSRLAFDDLLQTASELEARRQRERALAHTEGGATT